MQLIHLDSNRIFMDSDIDGILHSHRKLESIHVQMCVRERYSNVISPITMTNFHCHVGSEIAIEEINELFSMQWIHRTVVGTNDAIESRAKLITR